MSNCRQDSTQRGSHLTRPTGEKHCTPSRSIPEASNIYAVLAGSLLTAADHDGALCTRKAQQILCGQDVAVIGRLIASKHCFLLWAHNLTWYHCHILYSWQMLGAAHECVPGSGRAPRPITWLKLHAAHALELTSAVTRATIDRACDTLQSVAS